MRSSIKQSLNKAFLLTLLGLVPAVAEAQYSYSTNGDNTITINLYLGGGGNVTIPSTITGLPVSRIGDGAFQNLGGILTGVTIPNSVISIGVNAFYECTSLTNVIIGNSVTTIGGSAFSDCSSLTSVMIPNSVTSIEDNVFSLCRGLANATIGSGVTNIGNHAFYNCNSLTGITIPNSVTSIGDNAFYNCYSPTNATIGNSVTSIGNNVFGSCSGLTSITIPNSVISIEAAAFVYCSSLTSVTIPNSVISIGDQAFWQCGLTNVIIGNGVNSIGNSTFGSCGALTSVIFQGNASTSVGTGIFVNAPATIYRYQGATGWGDFFANRPVVIIGPTSTPPSIANQPQDVLVNAHGSAAFSVNALGTLPLHYQWSLNNTNIVGATTSTLTIPNVKQSDLGAYAVIVTNGYGAVTSSIANLKMYPYLAVPFGGAVTYWGKDTTLSVGAWGSGALNYQWYLNGGAIGDATNSTLVFTSVEFTNAGLYSVVVSSSLGSVTNIPAQVVVNAADVSLGFSPTVRISGVAGYSYVIQRSVDLTDTNAWVTLANLTLTQPVMLWVDTNVDVFTALSTKYFYRVLPGQ